MHIPDNFLSPSTYAVLGVSMLPVWKASSDKVKSELTKKKIPLLGVFAAFSFLIMMFNIPLPWGTTGHAVGAVLAAILLGPYAACISITTALLIQALFFGDGGILALGANCFNMAFIMPFSGYFIYKIFIDRVKSKRGEYFAVFAAAYIGIVLAVFFAAVEFGIQPMLFRDSSGLAIYCPYDLKVSIPALLLPHLLIVGFMEGFITVGVYVYIKRTSAPTIYEREKIKLKSLYTYLAVLAFLSPIGLLAAGTAWGEWRKEELEKIIGFIPKGMDKGFSVNTLMSGYTIKGSSVSLGYIVSAVIGTLIIIGIFKLISSNKKLSGD